MAEVFTRVYDIAKFNESLREAAARQEERINRAIDEIALQTLEDGTQGVLVTHVADSVIIEMSTDVPPGEIHHKTIWGNYPKEETGMDEDLKSLTHDRLVGMVKYLATQLHNEMMLSYDGPYDLGEDNHKDSVNYLIEEAHDAVKDGWNG